jgi:nucleotide-binding universal stress UspA family protein
MKWIVGLSFNQGDITPAVVSAWAGQGADICLVHVIDRARSRFADAATREQMRTGAARALEETAQKAGLDRARTEIVVESDASPETVLAKLATDRGADGIITSRRGETSVLHLGRTVRRLLRMLPVPVMVVPPKLTVDAIGAGPVLLAGGGGFSRTRR